MCMLHQVTMDPQLFLTQRRLFTSVRTQDNINTLPVEETLVVIRDGILNVMSLNRQAIASFQPKASTKRHHREVGFAAQAFIESNLGSPLQLADIGPEVSFSALEQVVSRVLMVQYDFYILFSCCS